MYFYQLQEQAIRHNRIAKSRPTSYCSVDSNILPRFPSSKWVLLEDNQYLGGPRIQPTVQTPADTIKTVLWGTSGVMYSPLNVKNSRFSSFNLFHSLFHFYISTRCKHIFQNTGVNLFSRHLASDSSSSYPSHLLSSPWALPDPRGVSKDWRTSVPPQRRKKSAVSGDFKDAVVIEQCAEGRRQLRSVDLLAKTFSSAAALILRCLFCASRARKS